MSRRRSCRNLSATANLNFIHSQDRRGFTGNDNVGGSPYTVFDYTPQLVNLNHRSPDGAWAVNPFGPANPFADAYDIQTPEDVDRFIGGGNIDWTAWRTEHQTLRLTLSGGADYTTQSDLFYAPPTLQLEQDNPSGLPGVSSDNYARITYLNYSINLVHHYAGLSWLDATTSVGYARDTRSLDNPTGVGQDLLAGTNAPVVGSVQTLTYNAYQQKDQIAVRAGAAADAATAVGAHGGHHSGAHDQRRRHQQVLSLPAVLGIVPNPAVRVILG